MCKWQHSSVQNNCRDKFEQYQRAGIAHYWLVVTIQWTVEGIALRLAVESSPNNEAKGGVRLDNTIPNSPLITH